MQFLFFAALKLCRLTLIGPIMDGIWLDLHLSHLQNHQRFYFITLVPPMSYSCSSHVLHWYLPCPTLAPPMSYIGSSHVLHWFLPCPTLVPPMSYIDHELTEIAKSAFSQAAPSVLEFSPTELSNSKHIFHFQETPKNTHF